MKFIEQFNSGDRKLEAGTEEIRKIGMTENEKKRILKYVLASPVPRKSPWQGARKKRRF